MRSDQFRELPQSAPRGSSSGGPPAERVLMTRRGLVGVVLLVTAIFPGTVAPAESDRSETKKGLPSRKPEGRSKTAIEIPKAEISKAVIPKKEIIVIETVDGRLELPVEAIEQLTLSPVEGKADARAVVLGGRQVPADDLLFIEFPWQDAARGRLVLFLRGGGDLEGAPAGGDENSVKWRCSALGPDPIPIRLESVKGLLVRGPIDAPPGQGSRPPDAPAAKEAGGALPPAPAPRGPAAPRDAPPSTGGTERALEVRLRGEIVGARLKKDELVLLKEGRVQGILEALDSGGIRFSQESLGSVEIPYEKIRALILAEETLPAPPPPTGSPSLQVVLTLRDGSEIPGGLVDLKAGTFSIRHPTLGSFSVPAARVREIAFLGGRSSYLSDLEPASVREECGPLFRLRMPFRRDTNVLGEPLRMAGRSYRKGLGVHSYSLLEYKLGGQYSRFQATIGLDESARPREGATGGKDKGAVVFRVRLDGKLLMEKPLTWRDSPLPVDLTIRGGGTLSLEVDYGDPPMGFNFALDRANWAEARVVK